MRVHCTLVAFGFLALAGCETRTAPPRGQIVLYLDSDAPLAPLAPGDTSAPTPLFDRVSFELFPPAARLPCDECSREFEVNVEQMHARTFSLGILPRAHEAGYRVRLRLYRSIGRATPRPESTIEIVAELPVIEEEGVIPLTALFRTDDVGRPRGTIAAPVTLDRGAPSVSLEGTWPKARVVDCAGPAPPGSVCVRGGAFFMGDPRVALQSEIGGQREHLVVLSPFFLDAREVTVADVRATNSFVVDDHDNVVDPGPDCMFTRSPSASDALPVTCVSLALARRHCKSLGGRLPTEAEFETVATLRGTSLYPWGDDDPACADAVSHRRLPATQGGCKVDDETIFPLRGGSGARDRVRLPDGEVVDLGANLSEWVEDSFQFDDEPCWQSPLLLDPVCTQTGRGGVWQSTKGSDLERWPLSYAATRLAQDADYRPRGLGFRCAYPSR